MTGRKRIIAPATEAKNPLSLRIEKSFPEESMSKNTTNTTRHPSANPISFIRVRKIRGGTSGRRSLIPFLSERRKSARVPAKVIPRGMSAYVLIYTGSRWIILVYTSNTYGHKNPKR